MTFSKLQRLNMQHVE